MVHSIWEMAESNQAVFLLTEFATQTFHLFNRGLNPGQETGTERHIVPGGLFLSTSNTGPH